MANRKHSRVRIADNPSGNDSSSAACSDWHRIHADSMMARASIEPIYVAGVFAYPRDCKHFRFARPIDQFLAFRGESIYDWLAIGATVILTYVD